MTVAADASDEAAMSALFDRFGTDLPPLGGIYLAAFGGGPVTLRDMTDDDVTAMFRPKLDAVALLHKLSLETPVRQFVLFSSISGVLGSRWLGHYAATTTFLDTFAYARRAAGLPATAINWGLWKSLADSQTDERAPGDAGVRTRADGRRGRHPGAAVGHGPDAPARSTVVAADWPRLATAYRTRAPLHILDDLLPDDTDDDRRPVDARDTKFREALRDCEPTRRRDLLIDHVSALVAAAMGLASPQIAGSVGRVLPVRHGLADERDASAVAERSLGEVLPASVVFDYPTVEALTDYLATILPELIETADARKASTPTTTSPKTSCCNNFRKD